MKTTAYASLVMLLAVVACGEETPKDVPVEGAGPRLTCDTPSDADTLLEFLADGKYREWERESGPHPSAGPHGGTVLTYVNDTLLESLEAGNEVHPPCSASVKELFLGNEEVSGYAVYVKVREDSANGAGWYWLETFSTDPTDSPAFEGDGDGTCVGCHSTGNDFVRTPFPLQ